MKTISVMVVCAMLGGCLIGGDDEAQLADAGVDAAAEPELFTGEYELEWTPPPALGSYCQGYLPYLRYLEIKPAGILEFDDLAETSYVAYWRRVGDGFAFDRWHVLAWTALEAEFHPDGAGGFFGTVYWWNSSEGGHCEIATTLTPCRSSEACETAP